jgi:glucose-1-phosphate cytidylyltransferase
MKVVLFCGGLGTRLREHSDTIPKPLVNIGSRPVLWHLMRYYAHYGHTDFVLALGYRGDMIREYFLNYSEAMSNDFTLSEDGRKIELHSHDLDNWRKYLQGEEMFLANYADGLSDLPLDRHIEGFCQRDALASFVAVRSSQSFHAVHADADGLVTHLGAMPEQPLWINGGFFVLRSAIFDYLHEGEELVEQPFARLIGERKLITVRWEGFWQCMDTFKDKITLDRMDARGTCPWMVWHK